MRLIVSATFMRDPHFVQMRPVPSIFWRVRTKGVGRPLNLHLAFVHLYFVTTMSISPLQEA